VICVSERLKSPRGSLLLSKAYLKANLISCIAVSIGGAEINICDKELTNDYIVQLAQEMARLPELQSLTFESNIIRDEDSICALFSNLRGYDRLENINIRDNQFSYNIVNALA